MIDYKNATELLDQGKTKDAYSAFLSIIEISIQQLHGVKFVQQTIVSKPLDYESSIQLLKSSVDQLEKITIVPGAKTNLLLKKSPPPLPPKPSSTMFKPILPPKPSRIDTHTRKRGNSVSFAKVIQVFNDQDMEIKPSFEYRDFINILLDTTVNPSSLVPAQTNTLVLPSNHQTNDYIPNVPAPPLLATHRRLQQQVNKLEAFPSTKKSVACVLLRESLDKVRSLYMSAMTIPNILQFSPHLIAYQLTLIESSIFKSIPKNALLSHSARTPHKKVVASTDFFNFMTRSIEHSILLPQEASCRAELIHRWIKIAAKLATLHNYQTLKAVVCALGTPPIQRLRRTWDCIPKKRMARLVMLHSLMSECDNYSKYREHMGVDLWTRPVVPFLGVFIHDVTYLSAAGKEEQVQDVLNSLVWFQRAPDYPPQPPVLPKKNLTDALHFGKKNTRMVEYEQQLIMQYLLMRPWVTEKTIDSLSLLREPAKPRSASSPTKLNSFDDELQPEAEVEKRSIVGGFWPFRKSLDMNRPSVTTTWSDDDDDDDEEDQVFVVKNRHSRSLSLPFETV